MTASLGASAFSSLFRASRPSSSRGAGAPFLRSCRATLGSRASRRVSKGAAGTVRPPPPGWAMSNQLRGQGALWTERDKRPCVRYGLLIYLALHPHAERTPRSLVRGGSAPGAPLPLAPWRLGAQHGPARGPASPRASAAPLLAQVPTYLGPPRPGSQLPPAPAPAPSGGRRLLGSCSAPSCRARNAPETAAWPRVAQRPAHLGFHLLRTPPLLDQLCINSGLAGNGQRPAQLGSRPAGTSS